MFNNSIILYLMFSIYFYFLQEIGLSGWQIIRKAGSLETVFKFHRTAKLEAGATVMVWSADIGATHEPPSNIVMKGQKWFTSDVMTTTLLNNDGEVSISYILLLLCYSMNVKNIFNILLFKQEIATSECKRQQLSTSLSRHRENLGFRPSEELHHQQVCMDMQI